ncbi:MAG: DUF664 domain-containing protein [Tepidiformaceae bacterium]
MDAELAMYLRAIEGSLERVLACLEGLDAQAIQWRPLPTANCLAAIARHALANAERNLLGTFAGQPYDWHRDEEFLAEAETAASLHAGWEALRQRFRDALDAAPASTLEELRQHPRMGEVTGRAVLLQAARHVAEHVGEAELTRALLDNR